MKEADIYYLAAGTLGGLQVVPALLGSEPQSLSRLVLPDYGVRVQQLKQVRQDFIRRDLEVGWAEKRGVPFWGATTLVPAPGERTLVTVAGLTLEQWQTALPRLRFWNYHDLANPEDEWFHFEFVKLQTPFGSRLCFTEMLPSTDPMESLSADYLFDPAFKRFSQVMADEAAKMVVK